MENVEWGVAFSGGGQLGFAHIGVIRALEEAGIEPVAIAGTSAGSIFGGFWACKKTAAEMEDWAGGLETGKLIDFYFSFIHVVKIIVQLFGGKVRDFGLPPGVFRGEKFYREMKRFIGDIRIKDIDIPLAIPAVDLDTGEEVIFSNRPEADFGVFVMPQEILLADAIRASIGVPGVFAPWYVAGRRLVDGGLADNLPVRRLRLLGAKERIAVDVGDAIPFEQPASKSLPGVLERSIAIMTRQLVSARHEESEVSIEPILPSVMIGDFRQNDILLKNGYNAAKEVLQAYFSA
ncbi:MAG: patatin-like phospholipase family protein [Bacillota bacterium]|nr:patatin-like phospholipase family protein [Bacillota bacterium]MDW7683134.1 patatin-like phospholipase family protein [Bacillota bacterium]